MKQLIIATGAHSASGKVYDYSVVPAGKYLLVDLSTNQGVSLSKDIAGTDKSYALISGRGDNKMPFVISEIDGKSLSYVESEPQKGNVYKAEYTIPTPTVGNAYTLVVVKLGVHFNKRNKYTASTLAVAGDTAVTIATRLAKELAAKFVGSEDEITFNLKVTNGTTATSKLTFEGTVVGEGYKLLGADALLGVEPTSETEAKANLLDKAWVQNLASQCAAGKGFNFTYRDGDSIYPGYPEAVDADWYKMVTLRFAVPRKSAKTRDEVVNQVVHIVTETSAPSNSTQQTQE